MPESHFATYDRENHILKSNLKELIKHYHVPKEKRDQITFITDEELAALPKEQQEEYAPMTQAQLAKLAGLRIMGVTRLANLDQTSINVYHLSAIAEVLRITDMNKLISIRKPRN